MNAIQEQPTERLEAEICELSGHIAAATARLLLMIAEYDRRGVWADRGCRSCVHWLSWKCAIGKHAAREKLRVGHALEALPLIRECFERGELSYSQVRAITRIAGPHNEEGLVGIARASTAGQLERLVAATAHATKIRDHGFAAAQFESRRFVPGTDYDTAMFLGKMVLTGDDGRLWMKALEAGAKQLHAERGDKGPAQTREQLLADAAVLLAQSFLANGAAARPASDEHRVIVHCDVDLIEEDTDDQADVDDQEDTDDQADVDADPGASGDALDAPMGGEAPRGHLDRGTILTQAAIRRMWCDTAVTYLEIRDGTVVSLTNESRTISASVRRALGLRDKQCRFPGCSGLRVDAHHIRFRRRGGPHTLENLALLCRFHHRLVHEGGYQMRRTPDGELRFYDPRGRQLHNRSALTPTHNGDELAVTHQALGIDIEPSTISPQWCGDRLDMHYAVSVLMPPERPRGDVFAAATDN